MPEIEVGPSLPTEPSWKTVSLGFDPTRFSVLYSFEEALTSLVGDAVYKLRPESTMNAAIVMLAAPGHPRAGNVGYAYRWYKMRTSTVESIKVHMRCPFLFRGGDGDPANLAAAVQSGRPFLFDKPVTLASAFLHHELQRRVETRRLLPPLCTEDGFAASDVLAFWRKLDEEKVAIGEKGFCRIENPGERYPGLHRETFGDPSATGATIATFIKPLVIRSVLYGLFCVDIAAPQPSGGNTPTGDAGRLDAFTDGLRSLGVGIEATLGACAEAYYTHLDRTLIDVKDHECAGEPPNLSAAFLETLISEVEERPLPFLTKVPIGYFFFDNNDLKLINTVGNYECGTEVIRATGRWIAHGIGTWADSYADPGSGTLRERLEAAPQWWVVRWGGDEFIAVVVGGKGTAREWGRLMTCISAAIESGRESLATALVALSSLARKTKDEQQRLADVVARTSVSAGGAYVRKVDDTTGQGVESNVAAFLRDGRVVAEDRMKLVKHLAKMDHVQVRMLLGKAEATTKKTIKALDGGLRWFYEELVDEG